MRELGRGLFLAAILLAALLAFSAAQARANLYVGGVLGNGVASLAIGPDGALSPVAGSPSGTVATNGVALTPDGAHLYATSAGFQQILAFDVGAGGALSPITGVELSGPPDPDPDGIAISPDGHFAYVADPGPDGIRIFAIAPSGELSPLGTTLLPEADNASGVAITPDGRYLYATTESVPYRVYGMAIDQESGGLTLMTPAFIASVAGARGISISPDGRFAYVAGSAANSGIQALEIGADGALTPVPGSPFATGVNHPGVAVSPLGTHVYATVDDGTGAVDAFGIGPGGTLIPVTGSPFAAAADTEGIALTADGSRLYAGGDSIEGNISAFTVGAAGALAAVPGTPFPPGVKLPVFNSLAVSPNQGPAAAFVAAPGAAALQAQFDARSSTDGDGTVARYDWDFGDGTSLPDGGPTPTHVYPAPGTYTATLTVTDAEGCSTERVFTGQTVSCNGSPAARFQAGVTVAAATAADLPPRLRVFGPRRQRLGGAVLVRVWCSERCQVRAGGLMIGRVPKQKRKLRRIGLRRVTRSVPAGRPVTLRLKLNRQARKRARKVLVKKRGKLRARINVRATDSAGQRSPRLTRTVKLLPPRKR